MSSGNFTYPPWSSLNFTRNCTLTAAFLTSWWESYELRAGPEINILLAYFRWALPLSYPPPTYGQIVDWYIASLNESQFMDNVIREPLTTCNKAFCATLGDSGNPDIAGIGMLVAYTIEAVMASAYLIAFLSSKDLRNLDDESTDLPQQDNRAPPSRLIQAFRGTIINFIESALLFSFAMLIASIFIAVGNIRHVDYDSSRYSMVLATLMSLFSAAVVLSVWPLQSGILRRKSLRKFTASALFILVISETYVRDSAKNENDWEIQCFEVAGEGYKKVVEALPWIPFGFGALVILIGLSDRLLQCSEIYKKITIPNLTFDFSLGWIVAGYGFASTWALFAIFLDLRQRIKSAAGTSYQENEWGFGQIMAVGNWAPVLIEFLYILFFGLEEGLEGRLPKPSKLEHLYLPVT